MALAAGEAFTLRAGRTKVAGKATAQGVARVRLVAPKRARLTKVTVRLVGSLRDRTGRAHVTVLPHRIKVATAYAAVCASDPQVVTITQLAPRERVTIRYRGAVIHVGKAAKRGTLTHRFTAHTSWGRHTVKVTAHRTHRVASTRFVVGRRCADGVWRCD